MSMSPLPRVDRSMVPAPVLSLISAVTVLVLIVVGLADAPATTPPEPAVVSA